jgi:SAM-dependent methyltransferase
MVERAQFFPGLLGMLVNPFYFARKGLLENILFCRSYVTGKVLDVGCGRKPYRELFPVAEYIGLEVDSPDSRAHKHADFFYDGRTFPFRDGEFDSVITNQVLEHVFHPDEFFREIHRVLKVGGTLLLTVPFVWDEHEQPWDYSRYSSFGLRHIAQKSGFEILVARKSMADVRVIFQLINAYLYKICPFRKNLFRVAYTMAIMAPFNLLGALFGAMLPGNPDLYLDNVLVARKTA